MKIININRFFQIFNKHFKTLFKNKKSQNVVKNSNILNFLQVNPKSNVIEKNINKQPDECNNNVVLIPYDNALKKIHGS